MPSLTPEDSKAFLKARKPASVVMDWGGGWGGGCDLNMADCN